MSHLEDTASPKALMSSKTVIRTKDYTASKHFYTEILALDIVEEYNDGNGSKGVIVRFGPEGSNAFLEISEIKAHHEYHQEAFDKMLKDDKVDIQLRTDNVAFWATRLKNKWNARGPVLRPWGSHYLYLRDPDGMQIIIYEEQRK